MTATVHSLDEARAKRRTRPLSAPLLTSDMNDEQLATAILAPNGLAQRLIRSLRVPTGTIQSDVSQEIVYAALVARARWDAAQSPLDYWLYAAARKAALAEIDRLIRIVSIDRSRLRVSQGYPSLIAVHRAQKEHAATTGVLATDEQVADTLGVPLAEVLTIQTAYQGGSAPALPDDLPEQRADTGTGAAAAAEVERLLGLLPDRLRRTVEMKWGLAEWPVMTSKEIAVAEKVRRETVDERVRRAKALMAQAAEQSASADAVVINLEARRAA